MGWRERWPPRDFKRAEAAGEGPGPRARRLRELRLLFEIEVRRDLADRLRYTPRAWGEVEDGLIEPVSEDVWEYLEGVLDVATFGRRSRRLGLVEMG